MESLKKPKLEEHQYSNIEVPPDENATDLSDGVSPLDEIDPRDGTSFAVGRVDYVAPRTDGPAAGSVGGAND